MRRLVRFALIVALLGMFAAPARSAAAGRALGDVPLVDQFGVPFRLSELVGRPAAITFVATRCQDTCPIVNALFSRLSREPLRARLVTISLDPTYDTPIVISNYARALQAHTPVWHFVTGKPADVASVLAAFGVVVEKGSDGIPDAHSDFIYILDRRGRLADTLPLSNHSFTELRRTLTKPSL